MVNNANKECGFEHEIVSYMYDELGAAERTQFETHLVDCTSCTDEFAAVSFSRFSVFEWQKEEFAHLATPEIVIPYQHRKVVAAESTGWFTGLTEIFAFARSPLAVGGAFAVLFGIGFIGSTLIGTGGNEIASNIVVPPVVVEQKAETPEVVDSPVVAVVEDEPASDEIRAVKAASTEIRPRAARQAHSRRVVENRAVPNATRQARRAPVLSEIDEDDEDSLRLSDLFDEIGG